MLSCDTITLTQQQNCCFKTTSRGVKGGSVVKKTCCSCRRTLVQFWAPTGQLTTIWNSSPRWPNLFLFPMGPRHRDGTHTHTTHTHKTINLQNENTLLMPAVEMHDYHSSTMEVEEGSLQVQGQFGYTISLRSVKLYIDKFILKTL